MGVTMSFNLRGGVLVVALAAAACFSAGCVGGPSSPEKPASAPVQSPTAPPASDAAGSQLAPGLYELEDGTSQAVGTLERRELEGGFWVVTGGTAAEGDEGSTVAVIANGDDFESELKQLEGRSVVVTGRALDGASIRMAGPEIEMASIEEMNRTSGAAE
jgi:hypothetical protein